MINGVIVIPQEARALAVGIVIVLELTWGNDIFCPAVPWRALGVLLSIIILSEKEFKRKNNEQSWHETYRVRAM